LKVEDAYGWVHSDWIRRLPSGKHTNSYGKSPFSMGFLWPFSIATLNYQRVICFLPSMEKEREREREKEKDKSYRLIGKLKHLLTLGITDWP